MGSLVTCTPGLEPVPDLRETFSKYYEPWLRYHAQELLTMIKDIEEMGGLVTILESFLSGSISPRELVKVVYELCDSTTFYSKLT